DPARSVAQYQGAVTNLPILEAAAKGIGSFTIAGDDGEMIRRIPLLARHADRLVPSLPIGAPPRAPGTRKNALPRDGEATSASALRLKVGDVIVRTDADSALRLFFTGPVAERTIPAWQVLAAEQHADLRSRIAGHIVIIGTSAVGLSDIRATPLNP